ncbi:MAG: serine/threonine protein kinase [Planctomycetes bacterium]|nr:serine/threonine protein kinase [Planctomycetota bacterium]
MNKRKPLTEIIRLENKTLKFTCSLCGKQMIALENLSGMQARCPLCQNLFTIPHVKDISNEDTVVKSTQLIRSQDIENSKMYKPQKIKPFKKKVIDDDEENTSKFLDSILSKSVYSTKKLLKTTKKLKKDDVSAYFMDFEVVERLGGGGMGAVFLVRKNKHDYALKLLDPSLTNESTYLKRFEQEAYLLSQIRHENVVRVYDFGVHENRPYILMEHCNGPSLRALVRKNGSMPWPLSIAVIKSVAEGLREAFNHGIVHRDIKPDNILFKYDERNHVKLVDFGLIKQMGKIKVKPQKLKLSKQDWIRIIEDFTRQIKRVYKGRDRNLSWQSKVSIILNKVRENFRWNRDIDIDDELLNSFKELDELVSGEHSLGLTRSGECFGTPKYMAPEMWLEVPSDFRADMFALGITWFWIVSGSHPFSGGNVSETMYSIFNNRPMPIENFVHVTPRSAKAMLECLMSKLPEQRYQSYDLLIEDLGRLLRGEEPVIDSLGETMILNEAVKFDDTDMEAEFLYEKLKIFVKKVGIDNDFVDFGTE